MSLRDDSHYQVESSELADWLEQQGTDIWWSVDGDPRFSRLSRFPCPADVLAAELRQINRPLLILDPSKAPTARGQPVTARDLDKLVVRMGDGIQPTDRVPRPIWMDNRVLYLAWPDRDDEWMLLEDGLTTEGERRDAALLAQGTGA